MRSARTLLINDYEETLHTISEEEKKIIDNIPPQLLMEETHTKLQISIDKYQKINEVFIYYERIINENYELLRRTIYDDYLNNYRDNEKITYDYCTGGSKAWYKLLNKHYLTDGLMSDYEKSAIHNTSFDLHTYINVINEITYEKIIEELEEKINNKITQINSSSSSSSIIFKFVKIDLNKNSTVFKIVFTCEEKEYELVNIYLYNTNKIKPDTNKINLIDLKQDTENHLNIFGLYIYNYISKNSRKPIKNDYDIYKVREEIYEKYILNAISDETKLDNKLNILYGILYYYKKNFKNYNLYDKYFIKNINKKIFDETENLKIFENILKYYFIERFRPYINYTIKSINEELINNENDLPILFAVGGDCCRRYKNDLSKTEDIDTKLYLNNEDKLEEVQKIIVRKLNELVAYLIVNKDTIINKDKLVIYLNSKGYDDAYIEFNNNNLVFSYYDIDKQLKYELTYYLNDPTSTFFKFRHIFRSKFPVDLYASDFQIKCKYTINKIDENLNLVKLLHEDKELTFDMAYLDISVDIIKDSSTIIRINPNEISSNNLPIARLLFLITDLINTYNNDESSIMRLINGKNKKDYLRFLNLVKILKSNLFTEIKNSDNSLTLIETDFSEITFKTEDDENLILSTQRNNNIERQNLDKVEDISTELENPIIQSYTFIFIKEYEKRKRRNTEKILLNFDLDDLNTQSIPFLKHFSDDRSSFKRPKTSKMGGFKLHNNNLKNLSISQNDSTFNNSKKSSISELRTKNNNSAKEEKEEVIEEKIEKKKYTIKKLRTKNNNLAIEEKKEKIKQEEKENEEFNKLLKENKEFKKINKLINTSMSNNTELIKNLFLEFLNIRKCFYNCPN